MSRQYFGYIVLHRKGDRDSFGTLTRIGTMDIGYIEQQALYGKNDHCHVRTDDGFCSTAFTTEESAVQVMELISKHDHEFSHFVRDFAMRNGFSMVKGKEW